jgi:hypothetical protein
MLSRVRSSRTDGDTEAAKGDARRASHGVPGVTASHQPELNGYFIQPRKRFWEVRAPSGELVCLTVYKRGAKEVVRRLCGATG